MELCSFNYYAIIAIAAFVFYLIKNHYEYWKKRDIPHDEPKIFFGNMKGYRSKVGDFEIFANMYRKYKGSGPFAGTYWFTVPSVVILDLNLVKNILLKDFNNFDSRGLAYNERDDPLSAHIFVLNGVKWKPLRAKLTPTFSSGKMKLMFPLMVRIGEELTTVLESDVSLNSEMDMANILSRYSIDVIGSCAFGLDCNSLRNSNDKFREMGRNMMSGEKSLNWFLLTEALPKLSRLLHVKRIPREISNFYTNIVFETVAYREKNNVRRNDFIDLLIDLKNKKSIRLENGEELKSLTMNEMAAQSFVFFLAGFDTSSTTMSFALYELAQNHNIQEKLRREINEVLAKHNGETSYEALQEMEYLDQVINETLRMYTPSSSLRRKANADYPTDNPKYIIPKGANVIIPIFAIHHDPDIFPNPEVFDPERFTPEEMKKRHPMAWLPFGSGPRNCIGLRFGMMQVRVGLSMVIKNFKFSITEQTQIPMKFSKKARLLKSERGIVLRAEKI